MGKVAAVPGDEPAGKPLGRTSSTFYLYLSLWMWALAIAGFGPGYLSSLVGGTWIRSVPVHVHAAVYVGWLAAFTYQANLPAAGRLDQHRRLGRQLVIYAVLMVVIGLTVTFSRFADFVEAGQLDTARAALIHPLSDMLIFPVLFVLAVRYRRSPETHKRLMVVATTMLLVAAVGRMTFLGNPPDPLVYDLVWLSPVWIAMLRDAVVYRSVHPAYAVPILTLSVVPYRYLLVDTRPYMAFTAWLAELSW
ncbi:MAG: hypothetical protein OEY08_16905 [Gammaproteobacteria bacterium]|nr:hypothetical protein [Gammaproteobacteria bacterium]